MLEVMMSSFRIHERDTGSEKQIQIWKQAPKRTYSFIPTEVRSYVSNSKGSDNKTNAEVIKTISELRTKLGKINTLWTSKQKLHPKSNVSVFCPYNTPLEELIQSKLTCFVCWESKQSF